jgi:hypothetical protein
MSATSRGQSRVPKELVRPIIQMQKNKIKTDARMRINSWDENILDARKKYGDINCT